MQQINLPNAHKLVDKGYKLLETPRLLQKQHPDGLLGKGLLLNESTMLVLQQQEVPIGSLPNSYPQHSRAAEWLCLCFHEM